MGRAAAACLVAAACAAGTTACSSPEQGNPAEQPTRVADLRPDLSSDEITDRDLAMAEQLGAPDDTISSLKGGTWPSSISRKNVRYAEAAEDYLRLRYGTSFAAYDCFISTWIIQDYNVINLRATEGEHEGESCRVEIWDADDPRWRDDWLQILRGPDWEKRVAEAARPILDELPAGTWTSYTWLDPTLTTPDAKDMDGLYGGIVLEISKDAGMSEAGLQELHDRIVSAERATGLRVNITTELLNVSTSGQVLTHDFVIENSDSLVKIGDTDTVDKEGA